MFLSYFVYVISLQISYKYTLKTFFLLIIFPIFVNYKLKTYEFNIFKLYARFSTKIRTDLEIF